MSNSIVFGFGDKSLDLVKLKNTQPTFQLQSIRQTHSDIVVNAPVSEQTEGDALITKNTNCLLIIKTADCLPILVCDRASSIIAAIHAGWRGVANRITVNCLQEFKKLGARPEQTEIYFGPHITKDSFECGADVAKKILASIGLDNSSGQNFSMICDSEKYLLDLESIVIEQIRQSYGTPREIHRNNIDTKTNLKYHSFRRDKEAAGRNLSFIGLS